MLKLVHRVNIDNGIKIQKYTIVKLLLIILVFFSVSAYSKNHQSEYQSKLHQYLIKNSDINSQLFGLLFYEFFDAAEARPILQKAINENSNKYTIYLADHICHKYDELTNWCHQNDIHQLHMLIDSHNLYTYLIQLNETPNDADISKLLNKAVLSSKYSDDFYFEYIPELQNKINAFNHSNIKLYAKNKKIRNKNYKVLFKNLASKDLIKNELLDHDKLKNQSNSLQIIMEIKMSNSFSAKNIKELCLNPSNHASCEKLMETLMEDKTIKQYVLGNSLLLEILRKKKAPRSIILKHLKSDKLESYLCYMGTKTVETLFSYDMDIMSNYLKIAKDSNEFEAAKQTSYAIFESLKQQGIKPDFDPKTCSQ